MADRLLRPARNEQGALIVTGAKDAAGARPQTEIFPEVGKNRTSAKKAGAPILDRHNNKPLDRVRD